MNGASDQKKTRPASACLARKERISFCFGLNGSNWDEEKVLDRYELLYEAGLVAEAAIDGRKAAQFWHKLPDLGRSMSHDHRRISGNCHEPYARQAQISASGF